MWHSTTLAGSDPELSTRSSDRIAEAEPARQVDLHRQAGLALGKEGAAQAALLGRV